MLRDVADSRARRATGSPRPDYHKKREIRPPRRAAMPFSASAPMPLFTPGEPRRVLKSFEISAASRCNASAYAAIECSLRWLRRDDAIRACQAPLVSPSRGACRASFAISARREGASWPRRLSALADSLLMTITDAISRISAAVISPSYLGEPFISFCAPRRLMRRCSV